MNATWPLAVFTATGQTITLRFRPSLLTRIFGLNSPFAWQIADVITAYPVRGRLIALNRGLAIESTTTPLAYFWTWRTEAVLTELGIRGLPVDWAERYIKMLP